MSVLYVVQIFIFCHFFANNWCASDGSREAFPGLCDEKMDATYVAPINFEDTCQFRHFPIRAEQLSRLPSLDVCNIFFSPTNRTRMRIRHLIVRWFLLCSLSSSSLPCSFDADLFHTQVLTSRDTCYVASIDCVVVPFTHARERGRFRLKKGVSGSRTHLGNVLGRITYFG